MRPVPLLLGALVFAVSYFSPVADSAMTSIASIEAHTASQRDLFYPGVDWMRDPRTYAKATAGQPPGRASLVLMGSSELFSSVPQNPRVFLPAKVADFDLFMSGRGYTQSLYHAIELAAMAPYLREKKVALIVSPQWFVPGGTLPRAFQTVFSDIAWHQMLDDPLLTPETKATLIARGSSLMDGVPGYDAPTSNGFADSVRRALLAPYDQIMVRARTLSTEARSAHASLPYRVQPGSVPIDQVDWAKELLVAQAEGASRVHNRFDIADPYLATYITPRLAQLKGSLATVDYAGPSPEYSDLELFLDVARELGVRVLLISVPMNGRWYDYAGYDAARRSSYYARIRQIADRPGVELADFSKDEYQPYFLYDVEHLGWIGWSDVIQACLRFERS